MRSLFCVNSCRVIGSFCVKNRSFSDISNCAGSEHLGHFHFLVEGLGWGFGHSGQYRSLSTSRHKLGRILGSTSSISRGRQSLYRGSSLWRRVLRCLSRHTRFLRATGSGKGGHNYCLGRMQTLHFRFDLSYHQGYR